MINAFCTYTINLQKERDMKNFFILFIVLMLISLTVSTAVGKDIEMVIKENECTDEGIVIRYSLINGRNFDRPNVGIGFKVLVDGKVVACKEIRITVPKGADGTDVKEEILEVPCKDKAAKVITKIFGSSLSRYKVEEWFSGCP